MVFFGGFEAKFSQSRELSQEDHGVRSPGLLPQLHQGERGSAGGRFRSQGSRRRRHPRSALQGGEGGQLSAAVEGEEGTAAVQDSC